MCPQRNLDRRFEVELPLPEEASALGESRLTALKRLYSIERKFEKDSYLREEYVKFQKEYEELQHMSEVPTSNEASKRNYLTYHAIVKESRTTTKVSVVLDASCKTSSGKSLNNLLMIGPVIQRDLVDVTIRLRQHPLVIPGDIEKMYRNHFMEIKQR
ncbi:uncharacterized protein LOC117181309 [Belonocnema kinseyi]|uniref:uncharacterized protein LOC117181309 n=1 Tax=Belonocnema kinseyi TaxID=2817044 RepID=UPI00143DBB6C|nr:uncharacterized protein LOC117181309 [Belonocnema kinseyi]